jgi:hypothetical protein
MARRDVLARQPFLPHWRISAMELWTADHLDLLGQAHLIPKRDGLGRMAFLVIEAGLDLPRSAATTV